MKRSSHKRGFNAIGKRIRQARLAIKPGVSQSDLAARLSVLGLDFDRPTITRIENGERYLRDYEVIVLSKVLKVSVQWLFDGVSAQSSLQLRKEKTKD
ncbi:MAG TPA: helix-turn-helix transcriptional regulator [Opitutaceae bacterium]|nr:helix-turn-helix transcriptional regulator [Opitutaceae bacterium]